jgi:hypothetical protein
LGADVEDDARLVGLGSIGTPAVVEVALRDLEDDRIGRVAEARAIKHCAIGR